MTIVGEIEKMKKLLFEENKYFKLHDFAIFYTRLTGIIFDTRRYLIK
jgi:hypothetical protein